jgi:transposase
LLWGRSVTAASLQDRVGARELLVQFEPHSSRLQKLFADGAYKGQLQDVASYFYGWELEIVNKLPNQKGFVVLPKRWIVERTLAWISKNRRLSKDYEFQPQSSEAMLDWAMIGHMLRRLTKPHT